MAQYTEAFAARPNSPTSSLDSRAERELVSRKLHSGLHTFAAASLRTLNKCRITFKGVRGSTGYLCRGPGLGS